MSTKDDKDVVPQDNNQQSVPDDHPRPRTIFNLEPDPMATPENMPSKKDMIINILLVTVTTQVLAYMYSRNSAPVESDASETTQVAVPIETPTAGVPIGENKVGQFESEDNSGYENVVQYWKQGVPFDATLYIDSRESITSEILSSNPQIKPVWKHEGILFGYDLDLKAEIEIPVSEDILKEHPIYGHMLLKKKNAILDPANPDFQPDDIVVRSHKITHHFAQKKDTGLKNLLGGEKTPQELAEKDDISIQHSYFHPNLTIMLVEPMYSSINYKREPEQTKYWIQPISTNRAIDKDGNGGYLPIIYYNEFWQLSEHMYRINDTLKTIKFNLNVYSGSMFKFYMYCNLGKGISDNTGTESGGIGIGNPIDLFKKTLLETSPYLLVITVLVSLLHSLFDFLAFKNDVQFWRSKKDSGGVSVRSMVLELSFEVVIFLYLFENMEGTSKIIIISSLVGLAISVWKIYKALDIKFENKYLVNYVKELNSSDKEDESEPVEQIVYNRRNVLLTMGNTVLTTKDMSQMTQLESDTQKYDEVAFKYLSWAAYPLLIGYTIYSLFYKQFKSWYSFVVSVLVGYVYTFGFISMTPQLYINYKLKSVAHMPWRTFIYKSLNTFVDDLFAFVMPMPTLHRIATLRDDVVFFIYLYQRYIYGVDHTRANEFGQVGEEPIEKTKTE
ncbi:hypothetical protein BB559_001431 [Furculomyces boomerangus]|uniref:Cleft lip and palate transmembrane 1 n=2 Tax=Harpellales TaxID=61421 RepID=A0A2T9Z212_9FUNG|nr:hypothetical protein BB559_001431 [Furculomyces boomerangus]PWA03615.1 hypothetical protein BB558_000260 [Smittium angustum]